MRSRPWRRRSASSRLPTTSASDDGDYWEDWLQTHRVELNAMTTPQLIDWLDQKMAELRQRQADPAGEVLEQELAERIESKVRAAITERILREAELEDQVAAAIAAIRMPTARSSHERHRAAVQAEPDREWRDHIEAVVATSKVR